MRCKLTKGRNKETEHENKTPFLWKTCITMILEYHDYIIHGVKLSIFLCIFIWQRAENVAAKRPQLRIVSVTGFHDNEEMSADALSIRGYGHYRCDDYHLGRSL